MALNDQQEKEVTDYVTQLEQEYQRVQAEKGNMANAQMSMFTVPSEDNLIKWQLDLTEDKERIYHLLKGDKIKEDANGNISYVTPEDIREIPFCDYGVNMIMQRLNYYLTKNLILSNYDEQTILWKVNDFGINISDYIHNNYEKLFRVPTLEEARVLWIKRKKEELDMKIWVDEKVFEKKDTEELKKLRKEMKEIEKINMTYDSIIDEIRDIQKEYLDEKLKLYPVIVEELVNTVHSAYLRALKGGERESLRTARTVTQNEPIGGYSMNRPSQNNSKRFSLIKPSSWV